MIAKKHIHMNTKRIIVRYARIIYNALMADFTQELALYTLWNAVVRYMPELVSRTHCNTGTDGFAVR